MFALKVALRSFANNYFPYSVIIGGRCDEIENFINQHFDVPGTFFDNVNINIYVDEPVGKYMHFRNAGESEHVTLNVHYTYDHEWDVSLETGETSICSLDCLNGEDMRFEYTSNVEDALEWLKNK